MMCTCARSSASTATPSMHSYTEDAQYRNELDAGGSDLNLRREMGQVRKLYCTLCTHHDGWWSRIRRTLL